MFDKKKLAFSNKRIFGYSFKTSIDYCFTKTSKMLISNKINYNGTIDETKLDTFSLSELWAYIYYLYYYNNLDLDEFKAMKSKETGKADAINFYNVVASVSTKEPIDILLNSKLNLNSKLLVSFINKIILTYGDDLVNPMFDYLKALSHKSIQTRINSIKLITGQNPGEFKIVQNAQNVKNANIKVSFRKTI